MQRVDATLMRRPRQHALVRHARGHLVRVRVRVRVRVSVRVGVRVRVRVGVRVRVRVHPSVGGGALDHYS